MNEDKIRIKRYEQAADEKVSIGGIKWLKKWDVCIQCDSRDEAERVREWVCKAESRAQNDFNPDWDAMTVMVEEQQRMAKHIEELNAQLAQPDSATRLTDSAESFFKSNRPVAWLDSLDKAQPHAVTGFQYLSVSQIERGAQHKYIPVYAAPPRESSCAECGQKKQSEGYALYCVECTKPMREWVGLTDEDMNKLRHLVDWTVPLDIKKVARAIEAALKAKNA